jgi:16S rRNA (guanine(966)-N(2))-methyltransferase RsmD
LKITGGAVGGRRLRVPAGIRPSSARIREALFAIWATRIPGARFLDLFAGSGAVGLEALSRGAASATFVERPGKTFEILRSNCGALAVGDWRAIGLHLPIGLAGRLPLPAYDLVFCDPPYAFAKHRVLLEQTAEILAPGGELACEHDLRLALPGRAGALELRDQRLYGDTALTFFGRDR